MSWPYKWWEMRFETHKRGNELNQLVANCAANLLIELMNKLRFDTNRRENEKERWFDLITDWFQPLDMSRRISVQKLIHYVIPSPSYLSYHLLLLDMVATVDTEWWTSNLKDIFFIFRSSSFRPLIVKKEKIVKIESFDGKVRIWCWIWRWICCCSCWTTITWSVAIVTVNIGCCCCYTFSQHLLVLHPLTRTCIKQCIKQSRETKNKMLLKGSCCRWPQRRDNQ